MPVPDAVLVSATRTAIGTAFKGTLLDVDALELGTRAVAEAVRRAGVDPALVDDVVLAESLYGGGDIARYAAIEAGLEHVAGLAHNRHCFAVDEDIVNVLGSGGSLGHPIAMTGARMVVTLIHELRRRGGGTGVAAMCAGGGMSTAVVLDVPAP